MGAEWPDPMEPELAAGNEVLELFLDGQTLVDEAVLLAELDAEVLPGRWGEILECSDILLVHPGPDLVDHVELGLGRLVPAQHCHPWLSDVALEPCLDAPGVACCWPAMFPCDTPAAATGCWINDTAWLGIPFNLPNFPQTVT